MATILQTTFSNHCILWQKICVFGFETSLKFIPNDPINNNSVLLQVMAFYMFGEIARCQMALAGHNELNTAQINGWETT